jgi:hypothetical protein
MVFPVGGDRENMNKWSPAMLWVFGCFWMFQLAALLDHDIS